jgi:hypothetical protein
MRQPATPAADYGSLVCNWKIMTWYNCSQKWQNLPQPEQADYEILEDSETLL